MTRNTTLGRWARQASRRGYAAALAALLAAGCSAKGGGAPTQPAAPPPGTPVVVDAAGGTVTGPGGASVTVPPGATATPVTIQVKQDATGAPALPDGATLAAPVITITPHGTRFDRPVTVRIPAEPGRVGADQPLVVLKAEPGGPWTRVAVAGGGPDGLAVQVSDFSAFALAVLPPVFETVAPTATVAAIHSEPLPIPSGPHRPHLVTLRLSDVPDCPGGGKPSVALYTRAIFGGPGGRPWWFYFSGLGLGPDGTLSFPAVTQVPDFLTLFGPLGSATWSFDFQLSCGSAVYFNAGPPQGGVEDAAPDRATIGTSYLEDLSVPQGTRPVLRMAVLGGPDPTGIYFPPGPGDNAQYTVDWQRSDDGGGSWRTIEASFEVDAMGDRILSLHRVHWSSATGAPVQPGDDGALFRGVACYTPAGGARDCAFSRAARLTVTGDAAPSFTTQPADALVPAGAAATFTVGIAGSPPPAIQWQASAPGSTLWSDIAGAASASYTTPAAALADTGTRFRAVATSTAGTATSESAALSVSVAPLAPVIVAQPVGLSVGLGAPATLAVDAAGTAPLAYQWAKDGTPIAGATAAAYAIAAVSAGDAGLYSVTVSNGVTPSATSIPAQLSVIAAPAITAQPASVTVSPGQAAAFAVSATGASLSYQWQRNGAAIAGATASAYTTPATALGDGGALYSVVVWNPSGAVVSQAALLTVVAPPAPAVTSVTPSHGPTGGGTAIAIAGTGFQGGATVTVGGTPATSVTFVSPTSLTALTPAGAAGPADVVVTNPDAQAGTAAAGFSYDASVLAVTSATPAPASTGNAASSTTVAVQFSAPLDCATMPATALQVSEGAASVAGTATCAGSTLTFAPSEALPTRTVLAGHVDAAVRALSGATLGAAYDWTFGMAPWTQQLGSAAWDAARSVARGPGGTLHLAAQTMGAIDGNALSGIIDGVAAKYAPSGARLWVRTLGVAGAITLANGAAVDAGGNLYVVGSTSGNLDGNTVSGPSDAFVAKYDAAGAKVWTRLYGTTAADQATAAAVDASGNLYVVGFTGGSLGGNTSAGLDDLFVLKLDGAGAVLWTRQLGSAQADQALAVALDGAGNVYVAGTTQGGLDGNTAAGSTSTVDGFLVKYAGDGTKQWTAQFGTSGDEFTRALAVDVAGNAYVGGSTYGALGGAAGGGNGDAFVVKYDTSGAKQWTWQAGSSAVDGVNGLAIEPFGGVFGVGATNGVMEAGATSGGGANQLAFALTATGTVRWLHQRESIAGATDSATCVTLTMAGDLLVAGITDHGFDGLATLGSNDVYLVKIGADGAQR